MFAKLKQLLAECHVSPKDRAFSIIADASEEYCLQRACEATQLAARDIDKEANIKYAIQLLNLARYKGLTNGPVKS